MLWLLRWGKKQNVAAEQKLVSQRQQAASEKQAAAATAGGASDAQPDTPTGVNGFANAEAQSQVCVGTVTYVHIVTSHTITQSSASQSHSPLQQFHIQV